MSFLVIEDGRVVAQSNLRIEHDNVVEMDAPDDAVGMLYSDGVLSGLPYSETIGKISEIEKTITPRRLREAVLTTPGKEWLEDAESEISKLRALL